MHTRFNKTDLIFIVLIPIVVMFFSYKTKSFWGDEILSIQFAVRDFSGFIGSLSADYHPPLYFLLLKIWINIFGQSEHMLRVFQGFQGAIFLFLSLILFRRFFTNHIYHPFWFLLTTSPEIWLFMPMLRYYLFAACIVMISSLIFFNWIENPNRKNGFLLIISYVCLLYTDYPASIVILIHGFFIILIKKNLMSKLLLVYAAATVLFLPWLVITVKQIGTLIGSHQIADLNTSFKAIFIKTAYSLYAFLLGETIYPFEIIAIVTLVLVAVLFITNFPNKYFFCTTAVLYSIGILIGGILFTSIVTTFISKHTSFIYTPSRTLFALPFIFLLFGLFYTNIQKKIFRYVLIVTILTSNFYGIYNWITNKNFIMPVYAVPWKEVLNELNGADGLMLSDESLCYKYYSNELNGNFPKLITSNSVDELQTDIEKHKRENSLNIFLIILGRESTKSEVDSDVIDYVKIIGEKVYEKKYLELDPSYRKIKSKILGRDEYEAKLTLYKYKIN